MQVTLNNGRTTPLYPGNGFMINGRMLVYEKYENDNCVIRDLKQKNRIFIYGYEGLKRIVGQYGYELMKERETWCVCFIDGHDLKYKVFTCKAESRDDAITQMHEKYGANFDHQIASVYRLKDLEV